MKLRWVKINHGVWVDRDGFYCIRLRSANRHDRFDAYEAYETYPRCPVEIIGIGYDLGTAKAMCQAHCDAGMEDAA